MSTCALGPKEFLWQVNKDGQKALRVSDVAYLLVRRKGEEIIKEEVERRS